MHVYIPTSLRSHTGHLALVEAQGETVGELLLDLDRRHPGFRFHLLDERNRLLERVRLYVNRELVRDLDAMIDAQDEIHIQCAPPGGGGHPGAERATGTAETGAGGVRGRHQTGAVRSLEAGPAQPA